jgi:hypothetical protein
MNIFAVDQNPVRAAHDLCDKHVVKMIVESCQMLSTAHRVLDGKPSIELSKSNRKVQRWTLEDPVKDAAFCKATMVNHPCTRWVMQTDSNYGWLFDHTLGLLDAYTIRYDKRHSMQSLMRLLIEAPQNIPEGNLTPFAQAMPYQYRVINDSVTAYRRYYIGEKSRFAKWKVGSVPSWFLHKY